MKITDERKTSYLFAGSLVLLLVLGMVLEIFEYPVHWVSIVTERYVPITLVLLGWWAVFKARFKVHFMCFIGNVKLLATLLPMLVLTAAVYLYHPVLFPVCAVFTLTTIIYIFHDKALETVLLDVVLWTVIFTVTALVKGANLSHAITILGTSAIMILMSDKLEWFFLDARYLNTKKIMALCVLVLGMILMVNLPPMQKAWSWAYVNVREFCYDDSFYETVLVYLGRPGILIISVLYGIFLVSGWNLVGMNNGFMRHYSATAMSVLTILLTGDVLKIANIELGFYPLGIGIGGSLEIGIWFTLACVILPPDHLLPNGRQYRFIPMGSACEKEGNDKESSRFWELYEKLTSTDSELGTDERTSMWEELWFEKADFIPDDDCWDELHQHFKEFAEREEVFCHDS